MISEVDINDWIVSAQPKKLYEVQRGTVFSIPGVDDLIYLHNLDGMYSYCTMFTGEQKGQVTHIAAFAEVIPWIQKEKK